MIRSILSLKDLQYDDSMLHVELIASNGSQLATQDFYCDPEDLRDFARCLEGFGAPSTGEAVFEIGAKASGVAHFVRLRAHMLDRVGHSAIEVEMADNASRGVGGHAARFLMACEPAAVNRLGRLLGSWVENRAEPLRWETTA